MKQIIVSDTDCHLISSATNKLNNMLGFVVARVDKVEGELSVDKSEALSYIFVSKDKYEHIKDKICFPLHRDFLDKILK